jgi:hypothetical protein
VRKLKQSEVKAYRENMLKEQGGKCAFCGQDCKKPCLDHAHREPYKDKIRGVICNFCNIAIGKLENCRVRTGTSWETFGKSFPHVYSYIRTPQGEHRAFTTYLDADWHPSKRKSEVTEFRKLSASGQMDALRKTANKQAFLLPKEPKNATQRIALFRKLNNKT